MKKFIRKIVLIIIVTVMVSNITRKGKVFSKPVYRQSKIFYRVFREEKWLIITINLLIIKNCKTNNINYKAIIPISINNKNEL